MRKLISCVVLLSILLFSLSAFAAPPPEQETKQLMGKYTQIRDRLESGILYHDFRVLRHDLFVATKQYLDKYPDGVASTDFEHLNKIYADIDETWQYKAEQGINFLPKTKEQVGNNRTTNEQFLHFLYLKVYYVDVLAMCLESKENGLFINSVVDNLLTYANQKARDTSDKINAFYAK